MQGIDTIDYTYLQVADQGGIITQQLMKKMMGRRRNSISTDEATS
jgi:hypothetical protein